jgi:hypothetical protein
MEASSFELLCGIASRDIGAKSLKAQWSAYGLWVFFF